MTYTEHDYYIVESHIKIIIYTSWFIRNDYYTFTIKNYISLGMLIIYKNTNIDEDDDDTKMMTKNYWHVFNMNIGLLYYFL